MIKSKALVKKKSQLICRHHAQDLLHAFTYICLMFLLLVVFVINAETEDRCTEIVKNLEQNSMRLKEYTTALQNAHKDRDFQLITVLNGQIEEALKQIRVGEAELLNCPKASGHEGPAISSVKTQDTKFGEVSCDELKKKYIQLSRKFNSLARRQKSLLSELTMEEKAGLRETEDSLRAVELELARRCGAPPAPRPFQRSPQYPKGTFR